jgi:hypothetical protein
LGAKDIGELRAFVKGLPRLLLLDRMSDLLAPVAAAVRRPDFHRRMRVEGDLVEGTGLEDAVQYILVRALAVVFFVAVFGRTEALQCVFLLGAVLVVRVHTQSTLPLQGKNTPFSTTTNSTTPQQQQSPPPPKQIKRN